MAGLKSSRTATGEVQVSSVVGTDAAVLWSEVVLFEGINAELMPVIRMTSPRSWRGRTLQDVQLGHRLFRSWLLLLGVVPVDFDDVCIVEVGPGYRFLEHSRMMSCSMWQHERVVVDAAAGCCRVTDRVTFTARWRLLAPVLRWFVPRLFAHRHRRLVRRYSSTA